MDYRSLDVDELIVIARDRLRDLEADHFRLEMTQDDNDEHRKLRLESKIRNAQEKLDGLLKQRKARAASVPPIESGVPADQRTEV